MQRIMSRHRPLCRTRSALAEGREGPKPGLLTPLRRRRCLPTADIGLSRVSHCQSCVATASRRLRLRRSALARQSRLIVTALRWAWWSTHCLKWVNLCRCDNSTSLARFTSVSGKSSRIFAVRQLDLQHRTWHRSSASAIGRQAILRLPQRIMSSPCSSHSYFDDIL